MIAIIVYLYLSRYPVLVEKILFGRLLLINTYLKIKYVVVFINTKLVILIKITATNNAKYRLWDKSQTLFPFYTYSFAYTLVITSSYSEYQSLVHIHTHNLSPFLSLCIYLSLYLSIYLSHKHKCIQIYNNKNPNR